MVRGLRLPALVLGIGLLTLNSGCVRLDARGQRPSTEPSSRVYTDWPFDEAEAKRRQQETARALGVEVEQEIDLGNGVKVTVVLIPAGEFLMGSPKGEEGRFPDERRHRVRISKPFYMGKYEVTQEQWQAVTGKSPSFFKGSKRLPVENVSWNHCQEFLRKAGKRLRLPTEAEWEYACRAGSAGRFCFGDDDRRLGEYAWYWGNSEKRTHAVGLKRPNAWGLHDMHGNVWEWCSSLYSEDYDGNELNGPKKAGERRVLRSGSWYWAAMHCRSANRFSHTAAHRLVPFGFRPVRDIEQAATVKEH